MPASKAFEGFAKKLLVGIGLFEAAYFKTEDANFSALYDKKIQKESLFVIKKSMQTQCSKKLVYVSRRTDTL
jgi:hypothetical protein